MTHFIPDRFSRKCSQLKVATNKKVLPTKNTTAAVSESALPIRTAAIVEMATDNGTLQKRRSTIDWRRKSCRFVSHAATYPVHKVTGRNAGTARRLSTACCTVMDEKLKMRPPQRSTGNLHRWTLRSMSPNAKCP